MNSKDFISNMFNVEDKTVIITGSAGRVGSRFSEVFSNAGANVVMVDNDERANKKLEKRLAKSNGKIFAVTSDISKEDQVKSLIVDTKKKFGKIDVLINNAHYVKRDHPRRDASFEEFPLDLWDEMIGVNFRSMFLCSKNIGAVMLKQKVGGSIINISSIYGLVGADQRIYGKSRLNSPAFYAATKGGMVNLTRYLAAYWSRKNIRVNTLTLGGIFDKKLHTDKKFVENYSNKTILGRMSNKDDYDGVILFLASDSSKYMTGANIIVDGGWTAW